MSTRKSKPSAGENGVALVSVPAPETRLEPVVLPLTLTMTAPPASSRASDVSMPVASRNGSPSKAMKISDPALAVNENMSTSDAAESAPLAYVAAVACATMSLGSNSAVAEPIGGWTATDRR